MKKRWKRIYIEITNTCNLSCSFCSKTKRIKKEITPIEFEEILKKINPYTDYLYLHVKGEPLLHPNLKELLTLSNQYHKKVTITTNGTFLYEMREILVNSPGIRQINISLHSENQKKNYLKDILKAVDSLSQNKKIAYRFWTLQNNILDKKSIEIVNQIIDYYHLPIETIEKIKKEKNIKIKENIYISKENQFLWPGLENDYYQEEGYCHGLKDQIAILSDGTIIPCCLDGEGIINLGNIYKSDLETILENSRTIKIIEGFHNRKAQEELCKHCSFKERFDRNKTNQR